MSPSIPHPPDLSPERSMRVSMSGPTGISVVPVVLPCSVSLSSQGLSWVDVRVQRVEVQAMGCIVVASSLVLLHDDFTVALCTRQEEPYPWLVDDVASTWGVDLVVPRHLPKGGTLTLRMDVDPVFAVERGWRWLPQWLRRRLARAFARSAADAYVGACLVVGVPVEPSP